MKPQERIERRSDCERSVRSSQHSVFGSQPSVFVSQPILRSNQLKRSTKEQTTEEIRVGKCLFNLHVVSYMTQTDSRLEMFLKFIHLTEVTQ